jgi:hypothetical protein
LHWEVYDRLSKNIEGESGRKRGGGFKEMWKPETWPFSHDYRMHKLRMTQADK